MVTGFLSIVALFASGTFLSLGKLEVFMRLIHRIFTLIFLLTITGIYYYLIKS
jgi:hypothetical protein